MNKFIENTFLFNRLGGCPQDQSYKNLHGGYSLVEEEMREVQESMMNFLKNNEAWTEENRANFLQECVDVYVTLTGLLFRADFNRQQIELAMSAVSKANLSKYAETLDEAVESVKMYEQDDRYSDVRFEEITFRGRIYYAIIGKTEDGTRKILKSVRFEKPDEKIVDITKREQ